MTTLRDLEYQIQANTDGLNKAFPALDKMVKALETLQKTVETMSKSYANSMNSVATSNQRAAASTSASTKQQTERMKRQSDLLAEAKKRVTELNAVLKANNMTSQMGGNIRSLQAFEKSMRSTTNTSYDVVRAKNKLNTTLKNSQSALDAATAAQRRADMATAQNAATLLKQQSAVERARIKYLDLNKVMTKMNTPTGIAAAAATFQKLEAAMSAGPLSKGDFQKHMQSFNAEMANLKRNVAQTSPTLEKWNLDMQDITKSLQVALGPLSGVASRFTAFSGIMKTNVAAIALLIGGFVALAATFTLAVSAASDFESEMDTISRLLEATDNRAGVTAEQVNKITSEVEQMTDATDNMARQASLSFLSLENFSGDMLKQALLASQGLSLIGRGDMISQARRLAKILEDPTNNLKALTEAGVFFNAVEAEKIKRLQQSGDLLGAQAAVLKRLENLQKAATRSGETLQSAWHKLLAVVDDFFTSVLVDTGALNALTDIINDLTKSVDGLGRGLNGAQAIGYVFYGVLKLIGVIAESVAGVINDTANAADTLVNGMRVHIANAIGEMLVDIKNSVEKNTPKFIKVPGINQQQAQQLVAEADTLMKSIKEKWKTISEGVKFGELPAMDTSAIKDAQEALVNFNLDPSIENFNKYKAAIEKAQAALDSMIPGEAAAEAAAERAAAAQGKAAQRTDQLLNTFVDMRNEFAKFADDEHTAEDKIKNLTTNFEDMKAALLASGNVEGAFMLPFVIREIEKGSTPLRKYVTGLEEQTKAQKIASQAAGATGTVYDELTRKQEILNNVLGAGISVSTDFMDHMEELPNEVRKQVEAIIAYTDALHELNKATADNSQLKSAEQQLGTMQEQLRVARMSDREQQKAMAVYAAKLEMINRGMSEHQGNWDAIIDAIKEAADVDFAAQQEKNLKSLEEQVSVAQKGLSLARGTTYAYDEQTAALQDQYEIKQKLGYLDQNELKLRQQLRELARQTERAQDLHQMDMTLAAMEKEVSLADATTYARKEQVAALKDAIELTDKYGAATTEELQKRAKIRDLQRDIDHNEEMAALQHQLQIQDKIVDTYFMTEGFRSRALDLAEKEYELEQKYGSLTDARAQKELNLFKAIQQRTEWIERNLKPIQDAFDSLWSHLEDGMVEFLENGKVDLISFARSIFEDIFRIMAKNLIFEPLQNSIAGGLSNLLKGSMPGIPGGGAGVGTLGTLTNPMYVIVAGGVPGTSGGGVLNAATALVTPGSTATSAQLTSMVTPAVTQAATQAAQASITSTFVGKAGNLIANVPTAAGNVQVDAKYAAQFQGFINELAKKYPISSIGGYAYKNIANTDKLSYHAYGQAIDINPLQNPVTYGGPAGMQTNMPADISQMAAKYGLGWGGNWKNKMDPMHFSIGANEGGMGTSVEALTKSTQALQAAQQQAATAATSMTSGVNTAAQAATTLGSAAVPAATQSMQTLATTGVVNATTGMTTTGTAALTTAASLNTLAASAAGAAGTTATKTAVGGLFDLGGMSHAPAAGYRAVSLSSFSGPRLAKGLMPNEFRAVLHRNEAVFNEDQLHVLGATIGRKARGRKRVDDGKAPEGGVQFHFHGVKDADTFRKSKTQMGAWASQTARRAENAAR